jgi:hypothetical protein
MDVQSSVTGTVVTEKPTAVIALIDGGASMIGNLNG